jgi:hypothetical protein
MLVCEGDPRTSDFYIKCRILEKETIKLKGKGMEHSGILPDVKRRELLRFFPEGDSSILSISQEVVSRVGGTTSLPLPSSSQGPPRKRPCKSADRDMTMALEEPSTVRTS